MSSVVTMATSSTAEDDTAQRGTEEEEEAEPAELERGRMTPDYSSEGERSAYNESTADSFDSSTREEDSSVEAFPSMAPKARNNLQEVEELVKQETMQVKQWRFIVFVLVIGTAVTVTTWIFLALRDQNDTKFQEQYEFIGGMVRSILQERLPTIIQYDTMLAERSTRGVSATSTAPNWPRVTMPDFDILSRNYIAAEQIRFLPILGQGPDHVTAWNLYTTLQTGSTINRVFNIVYHTTTTTSNYTSTTTAATTTTDHSFHTVEETGESTDPVIPHWQIYPPQVGLINYNAWNQTWFRQAYEEVQSTRRSVLVPYPNSYEQPSDSPPRMVSVSPIFLDESSSSAIVGFISTVLRTWEEFFLADIILPVSMAGDASVVSIVVSYCKEPQHTYDLRANGSATFMGYGDLHNRKYSDMVLTVMDHFPQSFSGEDLIQISPSCSWTVSVYPTQELYENSQDRQLIRMTTIIAIIFVLLLLTFVVYEVILRAQKRKILASAAKFNKVVSSLFPSNIHNRIFGDEEETREKKPPKPRQRRKGRRRKLGKKWKRRNRSGVLTLKAFLEYDEESENRNDENNAGEGEENDDIFYKDKPIADLYTDTTVLFADIVGFTAWSSVREPSQVFTLLETLYRAFDKIAHRRRVFKVETVGDCYVAVCGLPEPRKDHAVVMARFAMDCLAKMKDLTHRLEVRLGPDTGDLSMRVGIHSGPVTAGVLRGERSRFQLFGDTMNTASRMESTGDRGRIQVSKETADLLTTAGKSRWLFKRQDTVVAKGKGEMETYWLVCDAGQATSVMDYNSSDEADQTGSNIDKNREKDKDRVTKLDEITDEDISSSPVFSEKTIRLINWNVEVLRRLLKLIVARRHSISLSGAMGNLQNALQSRKLSLSNQYDEELLNPIDEVQEVIKFSDFHVKVKDLDPDAIELDDEVEEQLYQYVVSIAAMYRNNPFHNFDHASHVAMSVTKLLSRIVAPARVEVSESGTVREADLTDHTYGITADPLTQFACVFSALIHDVDHTGVPNMQLVKEQCELAAVYDNKSVAEQNSVDLAWKLLMDPQYAELCGTIYSNEAERRRFRHLVVNSVMATDIIDKDLKQLRNDRWEKAFAQKPARRGSLQLGGGGMNRENIHRKATIVIEHLIQASDIAHTMQHWHIYRKWNERLFQEISIAHRKGRGDKDPAEFWYEGELGFFDYYIIPLAKKLKDCGVFGVSSDEYLNYAMKNRQEWETRGREVVAEMVENFQNEFGDLYSSQPEALPKTH